MIRAPTAEQQANAFRRGAQVRYGGPTTVALPEGYACRDLVLAKKGDPDPWLCVLVSDQNGLRRVELASAVGRRLSLLSQAVTGEDVLIVDAALRAYEGAHDRHGPEADRARAEAGSIALRARDAHTRAALTSAVDGWAAARALGVINESKADGCLCKAPENTRARILIVTCPSTGRQYAHLVPENMKTAAEARRWIMGLGPTETPDAES